VHFGKDVEKNLMFRLTTSYVHDSAQSKRPTPIKLRMTTLHLVGPSSFWFSWFVLKLILKHRPMIFSAL
jgi:hypothetical protein